MKIRNIIYCISSLFLAGAHLTSCTPDEPNQAPSSVGITLKAAQMDTPLTSGNFTGAELGETVIQPGEKINNWSVAICNSARTVLMVIDGNAHGAMDDTHSEYIELKTGSYTAVAFANMACPLAEGNTLAANWKKSVYTLSTEAMTASGLVPMTGFKEFTVTAGMKETIAIDLVRMLCKVEFAVKNLTENTTVSIDTISLKPVYKNSIYLYPDYATLPTPDTQYPDSVPPLPESGIAAYETVTNVYTDFALQNKGDVMSKHFYIKESVAEGHHPTDHFHIKLSLTRGGNTEDVTYALADDKLKFFYRNDYVLFPISISDYVPEFEVLDYPPIGGYPVDVESEGNEFFARFSSSGAFDLRARLRNSSGQTMAIEEYKEGAGQTSWVKYDPDASVPKGFKLTYDPSLGEWQGNFDQGATLPIVLVFNFNIDRLNYTRKLYLLDKQN